MADNIEDELAVSTGISKLIGGWPSKRDTTKDERTCMIREFLVAVVALISH
jgi:hypothetical protein